MMRRRRLRLWSAFIIMTMGLITCCGSVESGQIIVPPIDRDAVLWSYVEEFVQEANKRGILVRTDRLKIVEFKDPKLVGVVGACAKYVTIAGQTWWRIQIIPEYRNSPYLKPLMFHELGHCLLELNHTERDAGTIMTPHLLPIELYQGSNWHWLLNELFTNGR